MNDGHSQQSSPLDDFVRQFWRDCEASGPRELDDYLGQFPGAALAIAREYIELTDQAAGESTETDRIGPFRVLQEIGRGGQGVVYLAEDTRLPRRVAIKVLNELGPQSTAALKRFRREAEVASRLDHPAICGIIDTGTARGIPYIVMPFIEGESLTDRFAKGTAPAASFQIDFDDDSDGELPLAVGAREPLQPREIDDLLRILRCLAEALHAAHEVGVVHRDIKPGNILVRPDGSPVILDLGLASIESDDLPALTMSGDVLGTPAYMSPEQIDGAAHALDRRSDVWSLGVTLYESLTGARPFTAATRHGLLDAIRWQTPQPPDELNAAIPRDLSRVLSVALAKQPEHRYATCADFAEDLRRVQSKEPILAVPPWPVVRLIRWTQRRKALATMIAVATLFLVVGLITSLILLKQSRTNLEGFERLVDVRRLAELKEAQERLWPAQPQNIAGMKSWLVESGRLAERLCLHEEELLRLRAQPRWGAKELKADADVQLRTISLLTGELDGLEAYLSGAQGRDDGNDDEQKRREQALERRQVLQSKLAQLEGKEAKRQHWFFKDESDQWRHDQTVQFINDLVEFFGGSEGPDQEQQMRIRLAAAIKLEAHMRSQSDLWQDASAAIRSSRHYGGLQLAPQMGLQPLGQDATSKLWEFAVIGSGVPPRRDDEGHLIVSADSAIVLVLIPGGDFLMGRADPERTDDGPLHRVRLRAYFIGKYEITQAQWWRVMAVHPSVYGVSSSMPDAEIHPVEQVSWLEATAFLRRLGLELPTEAQWEYATRAGTTTEYFSGDEVLSLNGYANIADEGSRHDLPPGFEFEAGFTDGSSLHAAIGRYLPNSWGLFDCAGNVAEWCFDTKESYALPIDDDGRRRQLEKDSRIFRGGSFAEIGLRAASGFRNATVPAARSAALGLRAARALTE